MLRHSQTSWVNPQKQAERSAQLQQSTAKEIATLKTNISNFPKRQDIPTIEEYNDLYERFNQSELERLDYKAELARRDGHEAVKRSWREHPELKDSHYRGTKAVFNALYDLITSDKRSPVTPRVMVSDMIEERCGLGRDQIRKHAVLLNFWGVITRRTVLKPGEGDGPAMRETYYALTELGLSVLSDKFKAKKMPDKSIAGTCKNCGESDLRLVNKEAPKVSTELKAVTAIITRTTKTTVKLCACCGHESKPKTANQTATRIVKTEFGTPINDDGGDTDSLSVNLQDGLQNESATPPLNDEQDEHDEGTNEPNPYRNIQALTSMQNRYNRRGLQNESATKTIYILQNESATPLNKSEYQIGGDDSAAAATDGVDALDTCEVTQLATIAPLSDIYPTLATNEVDAKVKSLIALHGYDRAAISYALDDYPLEYWEHYEELATARRTGVQS